MSESPIKNCTAAIGTAFMAQLLVRRIAMLPLAMPQLANSAAAAQLLDSIALLLSLLAAMHLLRRETSLPLYARRFEPAGSAPLFCLLFAAQVLLTALCSALALLMGADTAPQALPQGAALYIWLAARLLIAPIFEERLFRGYVLSRLLPYGDGGALLVSSLLFALAHGSVWQLLPTFTSGLVLGIAALRHGLGVSICLHAINNLLAVVLLVLQQSGFAAAAQGVYILSALLCAAAAWRRRKALPQMRLRSVNINLYLSAPLLATAALMLALMF